MSTTYKEVKNSKSIGFGDTCTTFLSRVEALGILLIIKTIDRSKI